MREWWWRFKRKTLWNRYLYSINILCSSVLLGICIQKKNVKRLSRSGYTFLWDLAWAQGRFMDAQKSCLQKLCLSVFLVVCLFVSNKRQKCRTDPVQIFSGTSHDQKEGFECSDFFKFYNLQFKYWRLSQGFR